MSRETMRTLCAACGALLEERGNLAAEDQDREPCPSCGSLVRRRELVRTTGGIVVASSLRVTLRSYFSSHLLWTAHHEAELAGKIEAAHVAGRTRFSIEHRGYVLSSIVASGAFLEAMVIELYQDAADEHAAPDGYITPLSASCWRLMAELWRSTGSGKMGVIEKYEMLLAFGDAPPLDRGGQTYEHGKLVLRLRNAILHFRPENVPGIDEAHAMERSLRGKFADNALMAGSDNSWWESHALGYGAADWAHRSVKALADEVSAALGIVPNYRRIKAGGWFEQAPGSREADRRAEETSPGGAP